MAFSNLFVSLPGRYAKAMFEIGKEYNILDKLSQNFETFGRFLSENRNFFPKYSIKRNVKNDLCETIGNKLALTTQFVSFTKLLLENCRMEIISNIASLFHKAVLLDTGKCDVTVYSSTKLSDAYKSEFERSITKLFKKATNIKYIINPDILSGLIIKADGLILDASGREVIRQLNSYYSSLEVI